MSQMYTILNFYNDKNEADCQMSMHVENVLTGIYKKILCVHNVKKKVGHGLNEITMTSYTKMT